MYMYFMSTTVYATCKYHLFIKNVNIFICINFMQEYLESLEMAVKTDMALPDQYDAACYREQDWTTASKVT